MCVIADVGLDVFLWNILAWMAEFNFPGTDGVQQQIVVNEGDTLFVVGANGSGKSSLMQRFFTQHRNNAQEDLCSPPDLVHLKHP